MIATSLHEYYTDLERAELEQIYLTNFYMGLFAPTISFYYWLAESDKRFLLNNVTY